MLARTKATPPDTQTLHSASAGPSSPNRNQQALPNPEQSMSSPARSPSHISQHQVSHDALQLQVRALQADLTKAQKQLEDEKNLRTERLRKASERCLALMSLSELGEGKVEVLRIKLAAERNLREKLEEEVECLRAADDAARADKSISREAD